MAMLTDSYQANLPSAMTAEEAADRVARHVSSLTARTGERAPLSGSARIGSRAAYRLWGAWKGLPGRKDMPIMLAWSANAAPGGSQVALEMRSDAGPYFLDTKLSQSAYQARFQELADSIAGLIQRHS